MEITKEKFIMGTTIEIIINADYSEEKILKDIENSFNIFSSLEKEFSRFDKNSILSKLNKEKKLIVSKNFIKVLELSKEIYKKTNGFFNPLVNVSNIGYSKSFKTGIFEKTNYENNLDFDKIQINGNEVILEQNQILDLGGIVKGYTVDLVKFFLEKKGYKDFLINAGGDIFLTEKSTIGISNPHNENETFALVDLENMSISTSGTCKRNWKIGNEKFHHILNPKNKKIIKKL